MDKLKKDDIQLEKVVSELKERLKYKDELNLNLIQRNRELKAKLRLQLSLKSELTENKASTIFGELGNLVIIGGGIFLSIELFPVVSTQSLICMLIGTYAIIKSISLALYGTRIGRYKKNKKLKSTIESLEENCVQLEAELKNLKEKSKYRVESDTKDYCAQYGSTKNASEVLNEDLGKVQVLKLTRKYPMK